jgi:hypothetical protein
MCFPELGRDFFLTTPNLSPIFEIWKNQDTFIWQNILT